jgi:hypothetical protein
MRFLLTFTREIEVNESDFVKAMAEAQIKGHLIELENNKFRDNFKLESVDRLPDKTGEN